MPLQWQINAREKLFEVVADGNVEFEDVTRVLDAVVRSDALSYRKLFDGLRGETRMTPSEYLTLGVRIRALHSDGVPLGPVAVVLPDAPPPLMRLLGIMAASKRPLRIFGDLNRAHRWLGLPKNFGEASITAIQPQRSKESDNGADDTKDQNGYDSRRVWVGRRVERDSQPSKVQIV